MSVIKPTSIPTKTLAESINASATSFKLSDIKGWDGNDLTSSDLGDPVYAIFRDSANTRIELMEIDPTTIADASITIDLRGLQFDGNLTTEVSANKLSWNKGDTLVDLGTDTPQLWQWLKEYIDAASIAGAVPAANVTPGIIKIASTTEINADTEDDGTYDYVPNAATLAASKYGLQLPSSDEKAALVGAGATPNTSNKFLTEGDIDDNTIFVPQSIEVFTTSGTWTKDAGLKYVIVEVVGGGGAGAAGVNGGNGGAGGGAGGYAKKLLLASELAATESVTVGAAASTSTFGVSGGTDVTATGGSNASGQVGGSGGSGSGGDINITGNAGAPGATGSEILGGAGGGSYFGGGGKGGGGSDTSGGAGGNYGGGGGGGNGTSNGGAGASGVVIVTEYYS